MLFKNKNGEIRSGWSLLLSLALFFLVQFVVALVLGIIFGLQVGLDYQLNNTEAYIESLQQLVEAPLTKCIIYTLMIGLLFLLFRQLYKRPIRQMGFHATGWGPQLMLGGLFGTVMCALSVVILLVTGTAHLTNINGAGILQGSFWIGLVFYGFVGFNEEQLSRGFMMTALKTTRNKWAIIFVPAVLFGLLHAANPNVSIFSLINIALIGVLFAYLFIKTGRLWAPIGFHFAWNFVQGYIFGLPVSGTDIPSSALLSTTVTGANWLTGGAFGVEGGAVCTLMIVLGILFIHFCIKAPKNPEDFWRIDGDLPLTQGVAATETDPEIDSATPLTDATDVDMTS